MQILSKRRVATKIAFVLGVFLASAAFLTYGQGFVAKDIFNIEDVDIGTVFDLAEARNKTIRSRHVLRGVFSTWFEQKIPMMRLRSRKIVGAGRVSYRPRWDLYFKINDGDRGLRFRVGDHGLRFSSQREDANDPGRADIYVGIRLAW